MRRVPVITIALFAALSFSSPARADGDAAAATPETVGTGWTVTPLPADPLPAVPPPAVPPPSATMPSASPPSPAPTQGRAFRKAAAWTDATAVTLLGTSFFVLIVEAFAGFRLCLSDSCPPPPPVWQQYGPGLTIGAAGVASYALGAPLVHAFRGAPRTALVDLVVRVGAPVALATLGYGLGQLTDGCFNNQGSSCSGGDSAVFGFFGVLAGVGTALYVDYRHLAKEEPDHDEPAASTALRLSPAVAVLPNQGASVGLGGAF